MRTIVKTYVGAYGIIIQDDKIVLIKKSRGGYKGKLDLPGGGIEHSELPNEALEREIMEEVGIKISNYKLFDVTATNIKWQMKENFYEDLHHIGILYTVKTNEVKLKEGADGMDSDGADWYPIKELSKDNLSPFVIFVLEKLKYLN